MIRLVTCCAIFVGIVQGCGERLNVEYLHNNSGKPVVIAYHAEEGATPTRTVHLAPSQVSDRIVTTPHQFVSIEIDGTTYDYDWQPPSAQAFARLHHDFPLVRTYWCVRLEPDATVELVSPGRDIAARAPIELAPYPLHPLRQHVDH